MNTSLFLFNHDEAEQTGSLVARCALPNSEQESLWVAEQARWLASDFAAEFSHSMEVQIGGQIAAGFVITGLYEDSWSDEATAYNRFSPVAFQHVHSNPADAESRASAACDEADRTSVVLKQFVYRLPRKGNIAILTWELRGANGRSGG